jgi:chromosome segregation ATPase
MLIDTMHNTTAAIQQLSKEQLELRNAVKALTVELMTANHRVTMLENETMASANQSQHVLNEMHNITEDYNTLKKAHDF